MNPKAKRTTTCQHCGGSLDFTASDAGKLAACPYCSKDTTLNPSSSKRGTSQAKSVALKEKIKSGTLAVIFSAGVLMIPVALILYILWGAGVIWQIEPATGAPPTEADGLVKQSSWDGSVSQVKDWLKAHANDPGSLQFVDWKLSERRNKPDLNNNFHIDNHPVFYVIVQYRAKNGFGALMLHRGDFVLSPDGTILRANPDMDAP